MALITLIFKRLSVPIAPHKTVGPVTILEYLGIELDTVKMEARLPHDKLSRIAALIQSFLSRTTCTKRELLSLLGHLNFACRVIIPGRTFISRLIEISKGARKLHYRIHLTAESRLDLRMWHRFLSSWNGVSMFLDSHATRASAIQLFTDASGIGFGGYFQRQWFNARWPPHLKLDANHDTLPPSGSLGQCDTLPTTLQHNVQLNRVAATFKQAALGTRTIESYATGVRSWVQFSARYGTHVQMSHYPPISEDLLIYFIVHCATHLHLKYSTIKVYLAGIRHHYIMAGLPNPLTSTNNQPHLRLQYTLRGIQRLQGPSSRPRLPITFDILRQLCSLLRSTVYGPYLDLLLESAFVLAFFGFLRCSEFTCSGRSFNPAYNLCVRDLNVQTDTQGYPDALSVNIKASKTDQMRRGFKLRLFATKSTICPVTTIHRFLRVRRQMCSSPQEPLFILPERVPLNRETFTALLRSLL
ncbi:uncharacterized protein [Ptychodera flava]|uniref:uncharacterized protein n=1 Tax=Ptychodera flava TaxID=63121 RepID=UPI00396AAF12